MAPPPMGHNGGPPIDAPAPVPMGPDPVALANADLLIKDYQEGMAIRAQAERLGQLLGFFAEQGRHGGYGQKQLAAELGLTPQALRRRSALALRGTAPQAMAVAQLHQLAQISVARVAQLRGKDWQEVAAWLQGLDRLLPGPGPCDQPTPRGSHDHE